MHLFQVGWWWWSSTNTFAKGHTASLGHITLGIWCSQFDKKRHIARSSLIILKYLHMISRIDDIEMFRSEYGADILGKRSSLAAIVARKYFPTVVVFIAGVKLVLLLWFCFCECIYFSSCLWSNCSSLGCSKFQIKLFNMHWIIFIFLLCCPGQRNIVLLEIPSCHVLYPQIVCNSQKNIIKLTVFEWI